MFFLITLHLHYLVYCLLRYSQITHLLQLLTYSDNHQQKWMLCPHKLSYLTLLVVHCQSCIWW